MIMDFLTVFFLTREIIGQQKLSFVWIQWPRAHMHNFFFVSLCCFTSAVDIQTIWIPTGIVLGSLSLFLILIFAICILITYMYVNRCKQKSRSPDDPVIINPCDNEGIKNVHIADQRFIIHLLNIDGTVTTPSDQGSQCFY